MSVAQTVSKIDPPMQTAVAITPMDMLDRAVQAGQPIEVLTKLMDLQERWEKTQARKAFDDAIASAKAEIAPIIKNREVDFTSQKGRTNYRYEDFAGVARAVDPVLGKYGLSYRFRATSNVNEPIVVTCVLSHRLGHFEETTLTAGRDESGNKNSIQGIGSTITYLQRYSLKAALGLSVSNDDDGKAAGAGETINEIQIGVIRSLIVDVAADIAKFCKFMKVERIEDIPGRRYDDAVRALEGKRAKS